MLAVTARLGELKALGVNIIWLMPVNPIGELKKKGSIGSPYAVRDYYGVNPAYGTPDDLKRHDCLCNSNVTQAREWRFVKPTLSGRDLQTLTGLKPGPIYGVILGRLRQGWLDGELTTPDEERARLFQLVDELTRGPDQNGETNQPSPDG